MSGLRQLEWLLRATLRAGLETVRATPALVDAMFPDLSPGSRDQLKDWLQTTEIGVHLAYPQDVKDVPCWTISMIGETPVHLPIGEVVEAAFNTETQQMEVERGEYVRKGYQIHTLTQHPDQTVVLAAVLQHILKTLRQDTVGAGFYEMATAQQDLLDFKIDYLPVRLYTRVTVLSVLVEDSYVAIDPTATGVDVGPLGTMDSDGFITVNFP